MLVKSLLKYFLNKGPQIFGLVIKIIVSDRFNWIRNSCTIHWENALAPLSPLGLLQFSTGLPPQPEDTMTLPASSVPHITVQEEDGEIRLLVIRAQGLLGRVTVEFRTVSLTAFSPEDYQVIHWVLLKLYLHL